MRYADVIMPYGTYTELSISISVIHQRAKCYGQYVASTVVAQRPGSRHRIFVSVNDMNYSRQSTITHCVVPVSAAYMGDLRLHVNESLIRRCLVLN